MQPDLNSIWTKMDCSVTLMVESRDISAVWYSCEYVYALPERVNRSRAGQTPIRTNDISMVYRIIQCRRLPYNKARRGSDWTTVVANLNAKRCAYATKTSDHFYSLFTVLLKQTLVKIAQTKM
jgi:hypothetical protein